MCYDKDVVKVLFSGEFLPAVVKEIREASESIWVVMFDWVWYPGQRTGTVQDVNRELCIKGKERADVRVLLHNESIGRHLHKINRVTAGHLKQNRVEVKWGKTGAPLHAKVWIFDRSRVIMGSHNISVRAVRTNVEVSVLFDTADEVKRVVEWFDAMWIKAM